MWILIRNQQVLQLEKLLCDNVCVKMSPFPSLVDDNCDYDDDIAICCVFLVDYCNSLLLLISFSCKTGCVNFNYFLLNCSHFNGRLIQCDYDKYITIMYAF